MTQARSIATRMTTALEKVRLWLAAFAAVGICVALSAPAGAAGDAANGRRLADTWCAGCHLIGDENKAAMVDVPPFPTIANTKTPDAVRAFLFNPHPPMPSFRLTRQDIEDLVEFIASLKKAP